MASKQGDPEGDAGLSGQPHAHALPLRPDGKPIALVPVDDTATPQDEAAPAAMQAFLEQWVK